MEKVTEKGGRTVMRIQKEVGEILSYSAGQGCKALVDRLGRAARFQAPQEMNGAKGDAWQDPHWGRLSD